jgi:hypothetical protein
MRAERDIRATPRIAAPTVHLIARMRRVFRALFSKKKKKPRHSTETSRKRHLRLTVPPQLRDGLFPTGPGMQR